MKWISVEQQFPPLYTDILVFVEEINRTHMPDSHMKVAYLYKRGCSEWESEEQRKDVLRWATLDTVLYWMHLPAKPQ